MVAGAQPAQREVVRAEVVDAGVEVGQLAAHDVEVDVVERAGAGGGAVEDLAAGIRPAPQHAGREVEQVGEAAAVERQAAGGTARRRRSRRAPARWRRRNRAAAAAARGRHRP